MWGSESRKNLGNCAFDNPIDLGRLSIAFVLRVREAESPLRTTGQRACCEVPFNLLIFCSQFFGLISGKEKSV